MHKDPGWIHGTGGYPHISCRGDRDEEVVRGTESSHDAVRADRNGLIAAFFVNLTLLVVPVRIEERDVYFSVRGDTEDEDLERVRGHAHSA